MLQLLAQILANNIGNKLTNELASGIMLHFETALKQQQPQPEVSDGSSQ